MKRIAGFILALTIGTGAAAKEPIVPANPLLEQHSNFFKPVEVWDLQTTPVCQERTKGLGYRMYSAVGFNLANTVLLVGPQGGIVVVDTLGSDGSAKVALEAFRRKAGLGAGKLPIEAIIYTHNHIDHTGGVRGVLEMADRPPCPAEKASGGDGVYVGRKECVEILAQEKIVDSVINTATVVGEIINTRSSYMYGNFIGSNRINDGIGPEVLEGAASFQMPSRTFEDSLRLSAAGMEMELIYVPSETDDELAVFLPDARNRGGEKGEWGGPGALLSAEVIQGPSFPNLYSLRGTSYRNPAQWFRSVDRLRTYDSWTMVPAHGVPVCGSRDIQLLLRNFRDAIQFTHDQSVRRINQGLTPGELAEQIHLPQYLQNDLAAMRKPKPDVSTEDYLRIFYGSVPQSVRELYFGYLGWYEADPVGLKPTAPRELARRTVRLMGGGESVLREAEKALARGLALKSQEPRPEGEGISSPAFAELEWAAELASDVIRAREDAGSGPERMLCRQIKAKFDGHDTARQCRTKKSPPAGPKPCRGEVWCRARETKAAAFLAMAEMPSNPNWRNWYISSAQELCGYMEGAPPVVGGLISPAIVSALPPGAWVNAWTMRLKAEETGGNIERCQDQGGPGVHKSLGFWFRDDGAPENNQAYSLTIRCAIAELGQLESPATEQAVLDGWQDVDLVLSLTRDAWAGLLEAEAESVACRDQEPFVTALRAAVQDGSVKVIKGKPEEAVAFFGHFDPPPSVFPALTLR